MMKSLIVVGFFCMAIFIMPTINAQEFEKATFQENATVIYDQKLSESVIVSIGFETTSNKEIRFSDELIGKINSNENIRAIVFTNAGECVVGITKEQQCLMINFDYENIKGDGGIRMVQESAKEMASILIDDLEKEFRLDTEFHSVFIHTTSDANKLLETSGVISGKGTVSATYVADKRSTDFLFSDLTGVLIPREIRDSGGFYDVAEKLSLDENSIISITIIPNEKSNLYIFKVAKEIKEKSIDITSLNVLENFMIDEISRSDVFDGRNVPLNSVVHLVVIPTEMTKINSISTHAITDLTIIENVMKKGWFMSKPAGEVIDLRFLFGTSKIVSSDELKVETAPWDMKDEMTLYSVEEIAENKTESSEEETSQYAVLAIIIAIGIGAAIFYLKGYKPKR